jgi:hypothetical protein
MQSFYRISADIVLVLHVLVVVFNLGALPIIWLGHLRGWRLARNTCFRVSHLLLVGFVTVEAALGAVCPLTSLEDALRLKAGGQSVYEGGFLSHWLHEFLYWDVSEAFLITAYSLFLGLVILSFFCIRPRPASWKTAFTR